MAASSITWIQITFIFCLYVIFSRLYVTLLRCVLCFLVRMLYFCAVITFPLCVFFMASNYANYSKIFPAFWNTWGFSSSHVILFAKRKKTNSHSVWPNIHLLLSCPCECVLYSFTYIQPGTLFLDTMVGFHSPFLLFSSKCGETESKRQIPELSCAAVALF